MGRGESGLGRGAQDGKALEGSGHLELVGAKTGDKAGSLALFSDESIDDSLESGEPGLTKLF